MDIQTEGWIPRLLMAVVLGILIGLDRKSMGTMQASVRMQQFALVLRELRLSIRTS